MDGPAAKKRRLAPKIEPQPGPPPPSAFPPDAPLPQSQQFQTSEAPPPPERHEFESFARHLQDAAMLIYHQAQKSPYTSASVLLLKWEDDESVEKDLTGLEKVFRERYNFRTDRWDIPKVSNPSLKLGVKITSFLEPSRSNHLQVLYYAGHGFVNPENQSYWASGPGQDASRLKWNGVRCLLEDSQSDMLILLDTCAPSEGLVTGEHGTKQGIAACRPGQRIREVGARSFTAQLSEALVKLSSGRPWSVESLYAEISAQKQQDLLQASGLTNGASKSLPVGEQIQLPLFFTVATGRGEGLSLCALPSSSAASNLKSPGAAVDGRSLNSRARPEDSLLNIGTVANLTFEEPRVLVCTTFVGEASPDMSSFHQWLHNTPATASKIEVEGIFLGPPTMLLISMPVAIWNVVQHDKVCCFLGYINSHNMTHLYERLVGPSSIKASAKDVEAGRMLLEAREVAATTPIVRRHDILSNDQNHYSQVPPETPVPPPHAAAAAHGLPYPGSAGSATVAPKDDVEDSAEMQEAAEQLKALSHVRHLSDEARSSAQAQLSKLGDKHPEGRHEDNSSHDANESGADESHYTANFDTSSSRPKQQRRSLQKSSSKQETQCNFCSHAPFKDSSSLRKHIAAAHTRPFPCAFAFAGCTSTFGSKNEWKRHIASQHLCLQYYRCSSCPQSTVEGKGNEFNRKDLFTQHLRRMHAPFAIKKAIAKGDSKLQVEWETHVKEMQKSCLVTRRQPPQKSACPKPDCASLFEGPTSWDEWTEHVGRHMEKGEANRLGVDRLLAKWALEEGVIERKEDGEYRLTSANGVGGGGGKDGHNHTGGYYSDGAKHDKERRASGGAAAEADSMEVDG